MAIVTALFVEKYVKYLTSWMTITDDEVKTTKNYIRSLCDVEFDSISPERPSGVMIAVAFRNGSDIDKTQFLGINSNSRTWRLIRGNIVDVLTSDDWFYLE